MMRVLLSVGSLFLMVSLTEFDTWAADLIPDDTCEIHFQLPRETRVILANRDYGQQRTIRYQGIQKSKIIPVKLEFAGGQSIERTLFLRGGSAVQIAERHPDALAPELVLQFGFRAHYSTLNPEGTLLWSDGELWDFQSSRRLRKIPGVRAEFHPQQLLIACSDYTENVKLHDLRTGKLIRKLGVPKVNVACFTFCHGGKSLAIGYDDGWIRIWDVDTARVKITFQSKGTHVANIAATLDQKNLLVRSSTLDIVAATPNSPESQEYRYTNCVCDASSGKLLKELPSGDLAISTKSESLAIQSDSSIEIWNTRTWIKSKTLPVSKAFRRLYSVEQFSPDGQFLTLRSGCESTVLFEIANGRTTTLTPLGRCCRTGALRTAFSNDGKYLCMEPTCGSAFDNPEIWSVATGQIQRTLGARHFPFDNIHFGKDFKSFRTSHNSVNRTNFVMTNDPEIGHTLFTLTSSQSADLENQSTAEFSHSVDEAGRIHIVEASHQTNSGETVDDLLKPIPGDVERFVLDAKTSPHDTYEILGTTLIASRGADNKVTVWDARTGRKKKTLMGTVDSSSKVFTDAKSGVLVAASDGLVRVWKIETGQMIASRQLSFTPAWIQFATDLPAIGIESELKRLESVVWDYERNKILFECDNAMRIGFETKDEPNFVTMAVDSPDTSPYLKSRDGKIIAASAEGTNDFCLWVKTGEAGNTRFFKLEDASEKVSNAQFSPGENYLITMSNAGIKAWDTKSGAIAATLGRGGNSVVNFNRDGSRLMIRTGHEIRFWNTVKWKIEPTVVSDVRDDLLSEDNRLVVFLTEKFEVQAWDFDSGRLIAKSHLPTVSSDSATIDTKMRHGRLDEIDLIQFTVGESIYLWNVLNDLPVKVYDSLDFRYGGYHGVWNSRMSFHSKGNLASIGDILIDLSTGKELASLHFLGEGDWLAVTPEGLFDGTEKGMQQVCYRIGDGLNVVPVEQFYQDFYRPGLLARIMNGERPLPDVEIGKSLPPKLRFIAPNDGTVTSDSEIMITVEAEDQGGGIQPLKLRRNGAPLRTAGQMVKEGNQLRQTFSVSLEPGDNILRLESASADGSWSSEPVVIRVKSVKDQVRPQLHVLTVGVSNYKADKLKLDFARRDAEAIGKLFFGRGKSLYEDVHLYPLYDGDATKPKLKSVCQQISKAAQPQDTLLIYLAGHGLTIGQRFFFIPADITLESRELEMDVKDQGIPTDTLLQSYLAGLTASKRMLVIDACNSGAAATLSKGKQRDAFAFQGAIERLARNEGLYVLAAASATEKAAEIKELQHGALTYSLLAAFGDVNDGPLTEKRAQPQSPDGVLSVFEWFSFASGEVPRLTEKYRGYAQEVRISGEGQSFPILPIEK